MLARNSLAAMARNTRPYFQFHVLFVLLYHFDFIHVFVEFLLDVHVYVQVLTSQWVWHLLGGTVLHLAAERRAVTAMQRFTRCVA